MQKQLVLSLSVIMLACAGFATSAYAQVQEKTRAQVHQELIQAESSDYGMETSGSSASGMRTTIARIRGRASLVTPGCTGPSSFCNTYFGS